MGSAPADGPDDFDAVAVAQMIPAVLATRHNLAIDLDRKTSGETQSREEAIECRAVLDLSRFAVDLNLHACVRQGKTGRAG